MTNSSTAKQSPQPSSPSPADHSPDCPFCILASTYSPISPSDTSNPEWNPDKLAPPGYLLLSTAHVIAFLDIAPLTRGHVLVAPRKHRTKIGDFRPEEMAELGKLLPLISRAVLRSVLPDISHDEADYNVVQNNGPGAAQVIPHVHFHIIPRPPLNYTPPPAPTKPHTQPKKSRYAPNAIPTGLQQSYIQFGRGRRKELDDEDAVELVKVMRAEVKGEWEREFGRVGGDEMMRWDGGVREAAWIEGSAGLVRNLERRAGGKL